MGSPLDRKPLAERVADAIESEIRVGRWDRSLPGYRTLAVHFGVSWRTSREALQLVEDRGLVEPPSQGKPRQVRYRPGKVRERKESLLEVTSSQRILDADEQELLDQLLLTWATVGGRDSRARVDYGRFRHPDSILRKAVQRHQADVVVMQEPSEAWARSVMRLDRPVFFLGSDLRPVGT